MQNWDSYGRLYDLMAQFNPAYQDILIRFRRICRDWNMKDGDILADLGAGTGNFSVEMGRMFPSCKIFHIDNNMVMNEMAKKKAETYNVRNIIFLEKDIEGMEFKENSISAFVCVHALYTFKSRENVLENIRFSLKPNGYFFLCDIGRILIVKDWAKYLFLYNLKQLGIWKTLSLFYKGRPIAKENRNISMAQLAGDFWVHSHEEFKRFIERFGFNIMESEIVYRGYSDLAVCRKL